MPELETASTSGIQFDAIVPAFDLAGPESLRELGEDRPMLRALLLAALAQTRSGPTDLMNSLETVDDIIGWAAVAPAPKADTVEWSLNEFNCWDTGLCLRYQERRGQSIPEFANWIARPQNGNAAGDVWRWIVPGDDLECAANLWTGWTPL